MSTSAASGSAAAGADGDRPPKAWPRTRRHQAVAIFVIALVIAGVVVAATDPFAGTAQINNGVSDNSYPTSIARVTEQSLSSQTVVDATLGYAGSFTVVNQARGIVTALPALGQVVNEGQLLYEVNGSPVFLLYGSTPCYRNLLEGVHGTDVSQLNTDLVKLGYGTSAELLGNPGYFSSQTARALERLQRHLDLAASGELVMGQAVFVPSAARITSVSATLGAPVQSGAPIITASSTSRQVVIALDAAAQTEVRVGDPVVITLPNNDTTPGVVSFVGAVATEPSASSAGLESSSTPTIMVDVTPRNPRATGDLDEAPVEVSITNASVNKALVVPVNALLALANGGYALEEIGSKGVHHLVAVTLGLFDDADGLVQVSGSGLAAGQRVVVPNL
ncbi:MAG: HlyD family efflux transporter periplasmic adaptor subunit [Acidimicrobiales bacterium]